MYSNLDYNADTMTLERFGFIGMDKRCFWGAIGILWKRPLPVDQILPNTTVPNVEGPNPPTTPEEKKKSSLAMLERFRTKLTATGRPNENGMEYDPNSDLFAFSHRERNDWLRTEPGKSGRLTVRVGDPWAWPKWYVDELEKPE